MPLSVGTVHDRGRGINLCYLYWFAVVSAHYVSDLLLTVASAIKHKTGMLDTMAEHRIQMCAA